MKSVKIRFQVMADQLKKELNGIKRFTSDVSGWSNLKKAADRYGKSVAALGAVFRGLRKAGSTAFKVLSTGLKAARNLALIGVGAITGLGAASLKSAADIEKLKLRLEGVTGSTAKANDVFKEVYKFFLASPFELEPLIEARILLEGLGITGQNSFESVANAAAIMDRDIVDMSSIMGGMEAEPLRNLGINTKREGEAFIFEYKNKMGEWKEVTANGRRAAQQELLKIFDIKYGGALGKLSQTWHGLVSTFKGTMKGAFAEVGEGLLPTFKPILKTINDNIQAAIDSGKLEKWGNALGNFAKRASVNLLAGVQTALDAISKATLGGAISTAVGALVDTTVVALAAGLMSLKSVVVALSKIMFATFKEDFLKLEFWGNKKRAHEAAAMQIAGMSSVDMEKQGVPDRLIAKFDVLKAGFGSDDDKLKAYEQLVNWSQQTHSQDEAAEIAARNRDVSIGDTLSQVQQDFKKTQKYVADKTDDMVSNMSGRLGFDLEGSFQKNKEKGEKMFTTPEPAPLVDPVYQPPPENKYTHHDTDFAGPPSASFEYGMRSRNVGNTVIAEPYIKNMTTMQENLEEFLDVTDKAVDSVSKKTEEATKRMRDIEERTKQFGGR